MHTTRNSFYTWSFKLLTTTCTTPSVFNVTVGHLKSGEDVNGAIERMQEMSTMLLTPSVKDSIILMDSNFSKLYPGGELNAQLFQLADYTDIVPDKGNECFKMRHARGGQPKKFCEFMFDRIDHILLPKGAKGHVLYPVIAQYPNDVYETLVELRTNAYERTALKQACIGTEKWIVPNTKYQPSLQDLYPNTRMPSDHPPIMANVTLPAPRKTK